MKNQMNKMTTKAIAFGALSLALAMALSYVTLWKMPQGGSLTLASMLPIMLYSYMFGWKKGLIIGFAYSLLQFVQDAYFFSFWQFVLDYPIAFTVLGLAGVFRKLKYKNIQIGFYLGILMSGTLRYVAHIASGVIFFSNFAGTQNPIIYSMAYNSFIYAEIILIYVIISLLFANKNMVKLINQDI